MKYIHFNAKSLYLLHGLRGQFNEGWGLYLSPQQKQFLYNDGSVASGALFFKVVAQLPIAFCKVNVTLITGLMCIKSGQYPTNVYLL